MTKEKKATAAAAVEQPVPSNYNEQLHRLPDGQNPFEPLMQASSLTALLLSRARVQEPLEPGKGLFDLQKCLQILEERLSEAYELFTQKTELVAVQ